MIPKFLTPEVVPYASVEIVRVPHKAICAWCDGLIRDGVLPVTHGICPACKERLEQEIA